MAMTPATALELAKMRIPEWRKNREAVGRIDRWWHDKLEDEDKPVVPRSKKTREYRELRDRSNTPWLQLIIRAVAQSLSVEGYRRPQDPDDMAAWRVWQANGLDRHQGAVHRDALAHGIAYVVELPGSDPLTGENVPFVEGVSSMDMVAWYAYPARDDWPLHALRGDVMWRGSDRIYRWRLYDDTEVHTLQSDPTGDRLSWLDAEEHDAGVCPVVRFTNELDLRGRVVGEIDTFIPIAGRINQDTFDRLVVQRFGSWRVRYATGMAEPETDAEKRAQEILVRQGDFLINESADGRFGTLEPTQLDGYIKAKESDIRELAATSQTPPHYLLGEMINVSAEALAAAEASLMRKVDDRRLEFGESWEQVLRLGAHLSGDTAGAATLDAQVRWKDTQSRSLAQAADALGKLGEMLHVPVEMLWEKIPGWTDQDVQRAKRLFAESDSFAEMLREFAAGGAAAG